MIRGYFRELATPAAAADFDITSLFSPSYHDRLTLPPFRHHFRHFLR
jgi:hypothetical protein